LQSNFSYSFLSSLTYSTSNLWFDLTSWLFISGFSLTNPLGPGLSGIGGRAGGAAFIAAARGLALPEIPDKPEDDKAQYAEHYCRHDNCRKVCLDKSHISLLPRNFPLSCSAEFFNRKVE
jgi:hypothetical protein